jgi:hypothetical protein
MNPRRDSIWITKAMIPIDTTDKKNRYDKPTHKAGVIAISSNNGINGNVDSIAARRG